MSELHAVLTRIDRLERENRRLKRAGSLLALALFGTFAASFATPSTTLPADGVLRGEKLELTHRGKVYATIGMDTTKEAPFLILTKDKGHALMTLDRPAVHVRDLDGKRGAFLGFETDGDGKIALSGEKLADGVRMTLDQKGLAEFAALDDMGRTRAAMFFDGENAGSTLFDARGALRTTVGVDVDGNSSMLLLDGVGRRRTGMLVRTDGTPQISLVDEKTVERLTLSMEFDGTPHLDFLRDDGRVGARLP